MSEEGGFEVPRIVKALAIIVLLTIVGCSNSIDKGEEE